MKKIFKYYLPLLLFICCTLPADRKNKDFNFTDSLFEINARGSIIVLTDYSSTDYYIYRGQPLGFQYELLQNLAGYLGVSLDVEVVSNLDEAFARLENGEVDLIAQNLTVTTDRKEKADFTLPIMKTRQMLVQLKPRNWQLMSKKELESHLVSSPLNLGGKTICVSSGSAYASRLENLSEEIGEHIEVIETDKSIEQLITMVSEGEIPYTVCDEAVAKVNARYYPDLDVSTAVSLEQNLAWAVRKGETPLLEKVNKWIAGFTRTSTFRLIYAKYYESQKPTSLVESDYYAINSGKISPYDDYIRQYSNLIGWDWRLLTSLIYQESRFKTDAVSWTGAFGLMQLMPVTASQYGVQPESPAGEQIRAGVQFIKWLDEYFSDVPDPQERIKFILAGYNIGPGHVDDARKLAAKNGADLNRWDNHVSRYLLLKSEPEYYNDPVVRFGYCKGTETYRFVTEVLERFEHYRNVVRQ